MDPELSRKLHSFATLSGFVEVTQDVETDEVYQPDVQEGHKRRGRR